MSALILFSLVVVGVIALQINNNQRRSSIPVPLHYINKEKEFVEQSQEPVFLKGKVHIKNVHQLRQAILDDGHLLKNVDSSTAEFSTNQVLSHGVIELMVRRYKEGTTPQNRTDDSTLAVAIEGGGMRGAVSAGMAAAIYSLGFMDSIDVIYGSSAGSLIGAYMISRQLCVDVYTDLLPNSKGQFVCKKRLISSLLSNFGEQVWGLPRFYEKPGMNISYVMDTILNEHGLRPLDMQAFEHNNKYHQRLRVASSCVDEDGKLVCKTFGTEDFTNETTSNTGRQGLHACLEASMMVPGATHAPVKITRKASSVMAFDAFCFEPLPYRSAVEEGATHVLVLRSRPQHFRPKTKPSLYETTVAPLYFKSHGEHDVAEFFRQGGQQYIYLEDHLTLEEGRIENQPIPIPPAGLNYGVKDPHNRDRSTWKRAHVYPLTVPHGTPELATLEQDPKLILDAVRGGFAAAFDLLAPAIGISGIDGERAAALVFPAPGEKPEAKQRFVQSQTFFKRVFGQETKKESYENAATEWLDDEDALALLKGLPSTGKLPSYTSRSNVVPSSK
jgi:predicted patatin/cPLA2 family phospholipase